MGPRSRLALSLRAKFLLIVLGGAVLPVGLVAFWLTRTAERSGEDLLRSRLDSTLTLVAQEAGGQWVRRRSALLGVAEDSVVQTLLESHQRAQRPLALHVLRAGFNDLRDATHLVVLRDTGNAAVGILGADTTGAPHLVAAAESLRVSDSRLGESIIVAVPVYRGTSREQIGIVEARMKTASLIPIGAGSIAGAGAVLAVVDRGSGASVVPLPFDPSLLRQERFVWAGAPWITAHRALAEPTVDLYAAAPLDVYTVPFQHAARVGLVALLAVVFFAVAVTTLLTRRVTRSLASLANAADAVSHGDLERRVGQAGNDEVGRVARAFDAMTESLRKTLRELSQRQAVAAVGEFASALAHEVRNPLSAIRLNLQYLEEKLGDDALRPTLTRALRDIERLDGTVSGALRVARSGRMEIAPVELWPPIEAAVRSAAPAFATRGAILQPPQPIAEPLWVRGDVAALEQVFLNLLINAAQALDDGGRAGLEVLCQSSDVTITVWDRGRGMDDATRNRVFEPFYSTKSDGSGLGLTVAQRIITAHSGTIALESTLGEGTRVSVVLPLIDRNTIGHAPDRRSARNESMQVLE